MIDSVFSVTVHCVSLRSFLKKLTYFPRVGVQVTVFSAMLGSSASACTASVCVGLDFTAFLSESGLGPLRSTSACGVDTPVVAQLRRRLVQLIVLVMG